jgi:predicted 3-demethylubiquinone-9 3-methyltransferase (glyoxalase superfamily)/uncharacterized protein YndB with AHSA1/START domain
VQQHLDAILEDCEGRSVLRFERVLHHPPSRVWRALTEEDELRRWHPSPFTLDARAGGAVHYLSTDGETFGDGRLTVFEPPRLLGYTWGDDELRWELRPHDDGTLLVLRHTFDDRLKSARDAAGWHLCLDGLARSLEGVEEPAPIGETALTFGWRELNAGYEERFGIDPVDATPPPAALRFRSVRPMLMFEGNAEEAMHLYESAFPGARIVQLERVGEGEPGKAGTVRHAVMRVGGLTLEVIDSAPVHEFTFTPSLSLVVECDDAEAVDAIYERLAPGGRVFMELGDYPFSQRYAWFADRFGVSWQLRAP